MISRKTNQEAQELEVKKAKINRQTTNKERIINERSAHKLQNMEHIRQVLEEPHPVIAGAIGENKVQKELEKLPIKMSCSMISL